MRVEGLGWLGIRTERFEETRRERDVVGFAFPDGTEMEVWRPEDGVHSFFGDGPVVGFRVEDVEAARAGMGAAGMESLGPVQRSEGAAWSHFCGPDGNVYEVVGLR